MTQNKTCTICKVAKPVDQFHRKYKDPAKPDHRNSHCIDCNIEYQKQYQARHADRLRQKRADRVWTDEELAAKREYNKQRYGRKKDSFRDNNLRRTFGITLEQYREMESSQAGGCAICGGKCPSGKVLAVDHNHTTGQVRGLLCIKCNHAIGCLNEDPALFAAALAYLEKFREA